MGPYMGPIYIYVYPIYVWSIDLPEEVNLLGGASVSEA